MIEIQNDTQNVNLPKIIFLVLFLTLTVISIPAPARAASPAFVTVAVAGRVLESPVPPIIVQDRTMVAVRFVSEAVGAQVEWVPESRQVVVTRGTDTVILAVGKSEAVVNGATVPLEVAPQIVNDRAMVPLRFIAEALGATVEWQPETRTVNIVPGAPAITKISATQDGQMARIDISTTGNLDYTNFQLDNPPRAVLDFAGAHLAAGVPETLPVASPYVRQIRSADKPEGVRVVLDLTALLPYQVVRTDSGLQIRFSPLLGRRIWIDAGHGQVPGGKDDPGSTGKFYKTVEKLVNLKVALELQRQLEAAGATVYMTRTGDAGVDFTERPALVNALQPPVDLFVSIHHNAAADPTVRGTETYYWGTDPRSRRAALAIHTSVLESLNFPDRKVRTEAFYVIKEITAPAVLVELGYLSNQPEEAVIAGAGGAPQTYASQAAEGIKNGILDYFWQDIRSGVAN